MLQYFNYNNIDIDEEIKRIDEVSKVELVLEPINKVCLFLLGILFAKGKKIKILNKNEFDLEETKKSFKAMAYVWDKLSDDNFPNKDLSNVKNKLDERIENVKRLGVKINPIINNPIRNKIFLICPVRNATENQKKWIENFVKNNINNGIIVHAPHLHTVQTDMFGGYAICNQNAEAVSSSNLICIYYDKSSTGSVFDLGVAYALNKPLKLLNENKITFDNNDFIDNIIKKWISGPKMIICPDISKDQAYHTVCESFRNYVKSYTKKKGEFDEKI